MKLDEGMRLPVVLVIDDQFGRCGLGRDFRNSVDAEVYRGYEADRQNLCSNYGLVDVTGDARRRKINEPLAEAIFTPGQVWEDKTKRIESCAQIAVEAARRGWPFQDGRRWALVLLDLRFVQGMVNVFGDPQEGSLYGLETVLPLLKKEFGDDLPIVILSSTSKDENNATARRLGALDYIQRVPGRGPAPETGRAALSRVLGQHGLLPDGTGLIVGGSLGLLKALRQARRGASSARNILIVGETGTGKGLLAQYIHSISARRTGPFEVFHTAHRPGDLQASELFGYWQGAFTGATQDTPGVWERADGGTLFIDEVADIDLRVQQMLMQPIEERIVRRLGTSSRGSVRPRRVDVTVILATNRRLDEAGPEKVRVDFLNRINSFVIELPPLRERRDDLPLLVAHLAGKIAPGWKGSFLPEAIESLRDHDWCEGNVRELRNVLEHSLVNSLDQDITARDMTSAMKPESISAGRSVSGRLPRGTEHLRWEILARALASDPRNISMKEVQALQDELRGAFLELICHAADWALRLTSQAGKPNLTAAARFLLGRDDVSTMEAKALFRRILALDTRGRTIARRLSDNATFRQHETLAKLIRSILA